MSVRAAIEKDLAALVKRDRRVGESGLAATALALAEQLDDPAGSATSKANCASVLIELMRKLEAAAPALPQSDRIDDLIARRQRRRAG